MSNTTDELKLAVERVDRWANYEWTTADQEGWRDAKRLILSERAELLATVEKMRGGLMAAQSFIADGGLAETGPGASIYRQVTAALTTGDDEMSRIWSAMLAASPQGEGSSADADTHRAAEEAVVDHLLADIVRLTTKYGNPIGTDYEQGITDHGNRCYHAIIKAFAPTEGVKP